MCLIEEFSSYFADKPQTNIKYQCCLTNIAIILKYMKNTTRKNWTQQEDDFISSFVEQNGRNWKLVAKFLKRQHGGKKTSRQCRQRWFNTLDPSLNKLIWTQAEQDLIFQWHQKIGSKWSKIAEKIPGRSDNSVKNQFYLIVRKILRRINKIVGAKNGTAKVKKIKPYTLSKLFSLTEIKSNIQMEKLKALKCKEVAYNLINFARKKLSQNKSDIDSDDIESFSTLLEELAILNQSYQKKRNAQLKISKNNKVIDEIQKSQQQIQQDYPRCDNERNQESMLINQSLKQMNGQNIIFNSNPNCEESSIFQIEKTVNKINDQKGQNQKFAFCHHNQNDKEKIKQPQMGLQNNFIGCYPFTFLFFYSQPIVVNSSVNMEQKFQNQSETTLNNFKRNLQDYD